MFYECLLHNHISANANRVTTVQCMYFSVLHIVKSILGGSVV